MPANWGLLPDQAKQLIRCKEWDNEKNLKKRLLGERTFPLSLSLKPPTDKQALSDVVHFQTYVTAWQQSNLLEFVEWQSKTYRSLKQQQVPKRLLIKNIQALLMYLGKPAITRSQHWQTRMQPLLTWHKPCYPVLVKHLHSLESMSSFEVDLLVTLLPQLSANMGAGRYLRALPLVSVDTKFIELFTALISDLLDNLHQGAISEKGDLLAWLGCLENPSGWLMVRPLCPQTQQRMGGFSMMKLSTQMLQQKSLPADRILVVENIQSGLSLPHMPETIAVIGGGRNVSWMAAEWLKNKQLAYWGDIDTWGLAILSDARTLAPHLSPLMMDETTLIKYQAAMVNEAQPYHQLPANLRDDEQDLFRQLSNKQRGKDRLEQERLPVDYCHRHLMAWLQKQST